MWAGYKTGDGIEPALRAQFTPLEDALVDLGIAVWPMVELEADDALASAAHLAATDPRVEQVLIWTPDKDLAQCVTAIASCRWIASRRRPATQGQCARSSVSIHRCIPDYLALVGDAADGYPGIAGIGAKTAAGLVNQYGRLEDFPDDVLGEQRELALLFKKLAHTAHRCAAVQATWTSCAGADRPKRLRHVPQRLVTSACWCAPTRSLRKRA